MISEEFVENKKHKKIVKIIAEVLFWLILVIILFPWIHDYIKVVNEEEPKFCIQEKTYEFEDGTVEECLGIGYKVYTYDRTSIDLKTQFGPFFMEMQK